MEDVVKETASEGRRHTIRWSDEEWDRLERAAEKLAADQKIPVAPVDIIRGASMHRADEILGAA